jgi:hypothetical protein
MIIFGFKKHEIFSKIYGEMVRAGDGAEILTSRSRSRTKLDRLRNTACVAFLTPAEVSVFL